MKRSRDEKYKLQVNITPALASKLKRMALLSGMPLTVLVRTALIRTVKSGGGKS